MVPDQGDGPYAQRYDGVLGRQPAQRSARRRGKGVHLLGAHEHAHEERDRRA